MFERAIGLVATVGLVAAIGCGGGSGGGGGGGDTGGQGGSKPTTTGNGGAHPTSTTSTSSGSQAGECCINDHDHYSCPSPAALQQCGANFDPSGCQPLATPCGSTNPSSGSSTSSTSSGSNGKKDFGAQCIDGGECKSDVCLHKGNADFGFCSQTCTTSLDCPSFYTCDEIDNGSTTYCVPL